MIAGKRALVTGGAGFMGSHLVDRLLAAGAEVVVLAAPGEAPSPHANVKTIHVDLREPHSVEACAAESAHLVFHLAGFSRVDESFRQVGECFDVNAKGTALLVEATRGAEAFVYASTSEVYGAVARAPFEETASPMPDSPYAIAKLAGEHACFARQRGQRDEPNATRFAVLRFFNVFGPRQRGPSIVASTVAACVAGAPVRTTKGEQTRDFLYIDDAIDALVAGAERGAEGPVNVCTGREVAIRDVVATVARLSATTSTVDVGALPYRPRETWRAFGDKARAERLLGFRASVSFDEGLARTIAWAKTAPPTVPPRLPSRS